MNPVKKYSNNIQPNWCPGCGHFSILRGIQVAADQLRIPNEQLVVASGIGCSGRLSGYMHSYSFHGIHGRILPFAQGVKLANKDLAVIAVGGDGDGFAIGTNHTLHAMRRNLNITYIVLNNQVYGLTKGHTSPLSEIGFVTKSTPAGAADLPLKPGIISLAAGVTYLAQSFSGDQDQMIDLIIKGIQHQGFSFINVFSPCITFNKTNTYQWYRENLKDIEEDKDYDVNNLQQAMSKLIETDGLCKGLIYQNTHVENPSQHTIKETSLAQQELNIPEEEFQYLMKQFQ
ncbi:2-oxoglutarate ferredoxin oxidoreductase subunit beta [Natronincola peptidivorans]|uniref:2-oxoglutarate ferredoxin oxidoreductase subunit beta n=1 Tax=Natronincola peptidivorans TaxID=426128 RepID=A0A1I0DX75_9FIRM|nr:2-oxoacid:ferredoxin oxidoreductase subunit beta [Natronincola peptidivorans]SET36843.1 2-oxoglutarate ferredoxin oxidoreductase subunit beta [Natronincola peptidivorans]